MYIGGVLGEHTTPTLLLHNKTIDQIESITVRSLRIGCLTLGGVASATWQCSTPNLRCTTRILIRLKRYGVH